MKIKILLFVTFFMSVQSGFAAVEVDKNQQLLNVMKSTLTTSGIAADSSEDFDADQYVNRYKRGWSKAPVFNVKSNEVKAGKDVIEIKITAFPDGRIQDVELLESTGYAKTDQKVLKALKNSKLKAMPYPDPTQTYDIIQKVKVTP